MERRIAQLPLMESLVARLAIETCRRYFGSHSEIIEENIYVFLEMSQRHAKSGGQELDSAISTLLEANSSVESIPLNLVTACRCAIRDAFRRTGEIARRQDLLKKAGSAVVSGAPHEVSTFLSQGAARLMAEQLQSLWWTEKGLFDPGLADIDLTIETEKSESKIEFVFEWHDLLGRHTETMARSVDLSEFVRFNQRIQGWAADFSIDGNETAAETRLRGVGKMICERLLPPNLMRTLWESREDCLSIFVKWDESIAFPLELFWLQEAGASGVMSGGFLGDRFAITHWISDYIGNGAFDPRAVLLIEDDTDLVSVAEEREALTQLFPPGSVETIGGTLQQVNERLTVQELDLLHLMGHGVANGTTIEDWTLFADDSMMRPSDIYTLNLGPRHPFVFLNTCSAAATGICLGNLSGWTNLLLENRAGGFIGPSVPVVSNIAAEFARSFYAALLDGVPIGEAARSCRQKHGWKALSYRVVAHPLVRSLNS